MEKLVNTAEITGNEVEEVREQVEALLGEYYHVVRGRKGAEEFFADCGLEGDIEEEDEQEFSLNREWKPGYDYTLNVRIKGYYVDPGASLDDYCFSVEVTI